jgi:hypothetical protein
MAADSLANEWKSPKFERLKEILTCVEIKLNLRVEYVTGCRISSGKLPKQQILHQHKYYYWNETKIVKYSL